MSGELTNHLWQSTVFAAVAGLLTLALRQNRARVRHWLWFAASVKFLIPLSMLVALGSQIEWKSAPVQTSVAAAVEQVVEPFTVSVVSTPAPVENRMPDVLFAVWAAGALVISFTWLVRWRRIRSAVRNGSTIELDLPLRVVCSSTTLEPGVFGILRPVLLLPNGIFDRLTHAQMKAILAHELCHVRHRDNLFAAIHMFVETIFWFHPVVWFIGKRMVAEREEACDEEVLRTLGEPQAYAEGILSVCKLYVESALKCVSGVTGADLMKRIEAIMRNRISLHLSGVKKAVLTAVGLGTFGLPIVVGVLKAPAIHAQSPTANVAVAPRPAFQVASVKPINRADFRRDHEGHRRDATTYLDRTSLLSFIVEAYGFSGPCAAKASLEEDCPFIEGAMPLWVKSDRFEIQGNLPKTSRGFTPPQVNLMLQVLLEDRFQLQVRHETKDRSVWALTIAKNGPKPKQVTAPELRKGPDGSQVEFHGLEGILSVPSQNGVPRTKLVFTASTMRTVAESLGRFLNLPVRDQTGLSGEYSFAVEVDQDPNSATNLGGLGTLIGGPFKGLSGSALDIGLQEIGLRIGAAKDAVEVLIIDHVERPSEN